MAAGVGSGGSSTAAREGTAARTRFPTHTVHAGLIGLVLSLAVFRFLIQDAAVKHVDKEVDPVAEKHSDRTILSSGIKFSFIWDPFLNSTGLADLVSSSTRSRQADLPAMVVIGSGMWYLRWPDSGGFSTWSRRIDSLVTAAGKSPFADQIVLTPVENAVESRLSPERAATVHRDDIDKMNAYLGDRVDSAAFSGNELVVPNVFNKLIEGLDNETEDGLHFSDTVARSQASILLNARCNDVLPKKFPFDKTCCSRYPTPNWVQAFLLLALLAWGPVGLYLYSRPDMTSTVWMALVPDQKYLLPLTTFGLAVVLLFIADRTSLFLKENKQYDALTFAALCLASLGAGLATMKPAEKDLGFLNRDQTDEWKGWMQLVILIYHYLGASKISGIYNPVRVLVAAYLFMSGYGHLSFFLKKADFGFARVANILIRLNLLTVVLAYVMNTEYLSYYFSPLVTIWFGIIWVTLWIGHQHNEHTAFLTVKLTIAAALTAAFFEIEGALETTFRIINAVFATEWNAREWRFRVTLDMWIVWIGMFTALAFIKSKEIRLTDRPDWPQLQQWTVVGSAVAMFAFFVFELSRESKFVYNAAHPYVSFVPVLAFVILRNATPYLRSTSSKFFIFFGQCSLETFIIQFHLFIAGDTRGIIMMIPGGPWLRPINFAVTSVVFVYVSNQVATATGVLTEWICNKGGRLPVATTAVGRTAQAQPLAGGTGAQTGDYVAVPTSTDGASATSEKGEVSGLPGASSLSSRGIAGRALELVKTDLRCKFGAILLGLTLLNWIYPGL
ncbi:hypothetical protein OIO90_006232 [Microbotryomycetes sp. JL221]|nr:hypothetical protein OIO90_006232 [Microbotryomycetes sp. JL221]